jgi:hypothetical protein
VQDLRIAAHNTRYRLSEAFLAEKDQRLTSGLAVSRWLAVDDSGARHQGRNGDVTQIGNDWFAWFASTESKSRINFLQVLHAGDLRYACNADTLAYWSEEPLPKAPRARLQAATPTPIVGVETWLAPLHAHGITSARHRRIATGCVGHSDRPSGESPNADSSRRKSTRCQARA